MISYLFPFKYNTLFEFGVLEYTTVYHSKIYLNKFLQEMDNMIGKEKLKVSGQYAESLCTKAVYEYERLLKKEIPSTPLPNLARTKYSGSKNLLSKRQVGFFV
uniref:Uncharacterized protein n=1 Tax=Micrurus spixii TaxID=129469 RepID=A0A2D4N4V1_9SAUR